MYYLWRSDKTGVQGPQESQEASAGIAWLEMDVAEFGSVDVAQTSCDARPANRQRYRPNHAFFCDSGLNIGHHAMRRDMRVIFGPAVIDATIVRLGM